MKLSDKMIEEILPVDNNTNSYVEANVFGLKKSRKCIGGDIQLSIREKCNVVCPENMWPYLQLCDSKQSCLNQIDLKNYFGKTFVCNKTTTKVLAVLFHFYSEVKKINTKYEIIMKENNEYQIVWSLSKKASKIAIFDFWMKQEIQDRSYSKIIHKFGFGALYSTMRGDYRDNKESVVNKHLKTIEGRITNAENHIKYFETELNSLRDEKEQLLADKMKLLNENEIKPVKDKLSCGNQLNHLERIEEVVKHAEKQIKYYRDMKKQALADKMKLLNENEIKPVKTKLILLSCGHQFRSEYLIRLLDKNYTKHLKSFECPYSCLDDSVNISGCYEANVYEIN
jgi:hypothetical protein